MALRNPAEFFHEYVANQLSTLLPYRKKNVLFGPQVCEGAAVIPMEKASFFVGCALALASQENALQVLDHASTPDGWARALETAESNQTELAAAISEVRAGCDAHQGGVAIYETIIGTRITNPGELLGRIEWIEPLRTSTLEGVVCGVLYPELAQEMLQAWTSQESGWQQLGVGGLSVDESPMFETVAQAHSAATNIYRAWLDQ